MGDVVLSATLRQGEVGPVLAGTPGDVLTFGPDGRKVMGAPASGGGAPLPRNYWVAPDAVGSTEDGSAGNPFLSVQAAIDALETAGVSGVLLLAASTGYAAAVVSTVDVSFVGMGGPYTRPFFNVTVQGGVRCSFENMGGVTFLAVPGGGETLDFFNTEWIALNVADCTVRSFDYSRGAFTVPGGSGDTVSVKATHSAIGHAGSFGDRLISLTMTDCIGIAGDIAVQSGVCVANGCELADVTCDTLEARGSAFSGLATVATSADLDSFSLQSLRANGAPHVVAALTISDRPLSVGLTFTVGVLAAAFADVTVALPGCKPGDTFDVTTTTRLADVGIVDAFCAVADVLTLRLFGTTAGGDVVCDVNLNANSA